MTEIVPSASYQRAGSSRPVLETTVGGVLREAAERAAGTTALVAGAPGPGLRRRWSHSDLLAASERVAGPYSADSPLVSESRCGLRTRRSGCC